MPCLPTSNSVAVRIFEVSENILKDWSDAEKLNMNGIKYDCIRIITVIILGSVYYVVVDQKLDDSFRHAFVREILNRISGFMSMLLATRIGKKFCASKVRVAKMFLSTVEKNA